MADSDNTSIDEVQPGSSGLIDEVQHGSSGLIVTNAERGSPVPRVIRFAYADIKTY